MFEVLSFRSSIHSTCQILQHQLSSINFGSHEYMLLIASVKHIYSFVSMPLLYSIFVSMLLLWSIRISFWRTCLSQMLQSFQIVTSHYIISLKYQWCDRDIALYCDVCIALLQTLMAISYSVK